MLEDLLSDNLVDTGDDIERVIEAGEDENQNGSGKENDNEDKEAENEADKDKDKTKVKRKLGPRPVINAERLKGPRGLIIMDSEFSDIKLRGRGKEREDLDFVMSRLEHWTHRLCPRMPFDETLKKIEKMGCKKEIMNYVRRIRLGMEDDVFVERPVNDEPDSPPSLDVDPFDKLLSVPYIPVRPSNMGISAAQREQMLRNRLIAEERRAARIKRAQEMQEHFFGSQSQNVLESVKENNEVHIECPQKTSSTKVTRGIEDITADIELRMKQHTQTEIGKGHTDTNIQNYTKGFPTALSDNEQDEGIINEQEVDVKQLPKNKCNLLKRDHNLSGVAGKGQFEDVESVGQNDDVHIDLPEEKNDTDVMMDIDDISAAIELGIRETPQSETENAQTSLENNKNKVSFDIHNNEADTSTKNTNEPEELTQNQFTNTERDEHPSDVAKENESHAEIVKTFQNHQDGTEVGNIQQDLSKEIGRV